MRRIRVIPTLLLDSSGGLVKTVKFGKRTYIGDPINAVKIFNDKGVDELVILDIDATRDKREPNYALVEDIVSEAFMPIGYGGGINDIQQMQNLIQCGLEKVILSTAAHERPEIISEASRQFGAQSVVVCLDLKQSLFGTSCAMTRSGTQKTKLDPVKAARRAVDLGAGELIVCAVDRDGTFSGYDQRLLQTITKNVDVPVVALGGARGINDFNVAIEQCGCSAVAAGSMFVYHGTNKGILISYPSELELQHFYQELNS